MGKWFSGSFLLGDVDFLPGVLLGVNLLGAEREGCTCQKLCVLIYDFPKK